MKRNMFSIWTTIYNVKTRYFVQKCMFWREISKRYLWENFLHFHTIPVWHPLKPLASFAYDTDSTTDDTHTFSIPKCLWKYQQF